jgi:hypothetical protein
VALPLPRVREYAFAATAAVPDVLYTNALQMQRLWGPIFQTLHRPDVSAFAHKAENVQAAKGTPPPPSVARRPFISSSSAQLIYSLHVWLL